MADVLLKNVGGSSASAPSHIHADGSTTQLYIIDDFSKLGVVHVAADGVTTTHYEVALVSR